MFTPSDVANNDAGIFKFDEIYETKRAAAILDNGPFADDKDRDSALKLLGLDELKRISDHYLPFVTVYWEVNLI